MYPLRFEPIFRRYLWGGRRLAEVLNKPIGDESCAESWEIVDHNQVQSIVRFGPLAGRTLNSLIETFQAKLLGERVWRSVNSPDLPPQLRGRFPLLLKFLDANKHLSVQVHPDDQYGATLDPPDLGKTEAWFVMHADQGARIYAGLKEGVNAEDFLQAVRDGKTEEMLHSFESQTGDCVFIRAGTMHAIGAGNLIAEIQQASDTTFRVFDWNRTDKNGKPRDLHIEQSIKATDFALGPVSPVSARSTDFPNATSIVSDRHFEMRKWELDEPSTIECHGSFHIIAVIKGELAVENEPAKQPLVLGQTMLIPAELGSISLNPIKGTQILDIFVP